MKSLQEALVHKHMDHKRDSRTILKDGDIAVQNNGICLFYIDGRFEHQFATGSKSSESIRDWDEDLRLIKDNYKGWRDIKYIYRANLKSCPSPDAMRQITNDMKPIWKRK